MRREKDLTNTAVHDRKQTGLVGGMVKAATENSRVRQRSWPQHTYYSRKNSRVLLRNILVRFSTRAGGDLRNRGGARCLHSSLCLLPRIEGAEAYRYRASLAIMDSTCDYIHKHTTHSYDREVHPGPRSRVA